MAGFFSRKKGKDGATKVSKAQKTAAQESLPPAPVKPQWKDAWTRKTVEAEEVQELLRGCTLELKAKGIKPLHSCEPSQGLSIRSFRSLY